MTAWAIQYRRSLANILTRLARLSNEVTDTLTRNTEPDRETFRELGLRLVGNRDLTVQWDGLLSAVANFDLFQFDPAACETWTDEMVRDDVAMAVWDLLFPGLPVCWLCRAQIGDGMGDTPAAVWWSPAGECGTHRPQEIVPDPWAVAS